MRKKSIELQKRAVMAVTTFLILATGCDDRFDSRGGYPSKEGKMVDVTLDIGLADEADGYDLSGTPGMSGTPSTKTGMDRESAFDFDLVPSQRTKAGTSLQPDALYNLEIRQYSSSGTYQGGSSSVEASTAIGTSITLILQEATHCQLLLVAWGKDNTKRLGTGTLAAAQDTVVEASVIKDLDPTNQADMNKMPYVLHLKDINVSSDGRIYSADGEAIDVRLRLQRLATRLTFNWTYGFSNYSPQQILLHSIPADYKVVAFPDKNNNTYPSLFDQFTTIQVPVEQVKASGSYSCWIPANVRGSNAAATSQTYRIKSNAPTGSSYISFIAVMDGEENKKKKLDYRIYLGGKETTDFNLYGNTDYAYTLNFTHADLPVNDRRVSIIDPIPASESNENFVPTANCFMVPPGGAFCFNPYKYYQEGKVIDNSQLKTWYTTPTIKSVRVFWQTKEDGDVGDPVLGVVNSTDDHENIVDLKNCDDFEKARIYCRVAPNTKGGSGVIVAYDGADGTGTVVWSWHIWVTDYNPDAAGSETVLSPVNKRKLKFSYNVGSDQLPMMDRNLGAMAGFTLSDPPHDVLDMSKSNGLHYQWGRKDPFPSSYSAEKKPVIKGLTSTTVPPKGMLNRYGPDGLTFQPLRSASQKTTLKNAYQNPGVFFILSQSAIDWCSESSVIPTLWNSPNNENGKKTFNDPCPAGWRVISYKNLYTFFTGTPGSDGMISGNANMANSSTADADGGAYFYYTANGSGEATYVRMTGYWRFLDEFHFVGEKAIFWVREHTGITGKSSYGFSFVLGEETNSMEIAKVWYPQDAQTTRCIQELP